MAQQQQKKIGNYLVTGVIGQGGMGKIYKAVHPTLKRSIILKQLLLTGKKTFTERFKREARIMIDLRNENVVQVFDHFKQGSYNYIAMEFVDGLSLEELIKQKKQINPMAAILIFSEICKGLKHAHEKGVVHRDIKPANVLISKEGEVKLTDFGIASTDQEEDEGITKTGAVMGTPAYMSPEQLRNTKNVDKRSDIYSMGVMLYEMVTGEKPFPSNFSSEAIKCINKGIYIKPDKLNPNLPGVLKKILRKMMHRHIKRRYQDLRYVLNIFEKYTGKYKSQKKLNDEVKKYLTGEELPLPTLISLGKGKKIHDKILTYALISSGLFISLLIIGLILSKIGFYFEFIKNKEYGALNIEAVLPEKYHKKQNEIFSYAILTNEDKKKNDKDKITTLKLKKNPGLMEYYQNLTDKKSKQKKKKITLNTGKKYFPAGNYKIDAIIENKKYFHSFYLDPRIVQKEDIKTFKKKTISLYIEQPRSKAISISHSIRNNTTGSRITNITDIKIYSNKKWLDWRKYNNNYLKSGRTYYFKYNTPGFYEKKVTVPVDRSMDKLELKIQMIPIPGTLVIESNYKGLDILINNHKSGYSGGKRKKYIPFGKSDDKKPRSFILEKGQYELLIRKDAKIFKNSTITILSNRKRIIKITYDKDNKKIYIK